MTESITTDAPSRSSRGDAPVSLPAIVQEAHDSSLAALMSDDFGAARQAIRHAKTIDPLNPLHQWRELLLIMRSGRIQEAMDEAERLMELLPGNPWPRYLRGLALLRQGDAKKASNVIRPLLTANPAFAPAAFLNAESESHLKLKGMAKHLAQLPKRDGDVTLWMDLLSKLIVAHGKPGGQLARNFLDQSPLFKKWPRERALLTRLLELSVASLDQLEDSLAATPPGSRSEEIILLFCNDSLDELGEGPAALARLGRLYKRFPERIGVRRVYTARLSRLAAAKAGDGKYLDALQFVQRCLEIEPHESIHYQNRAAIFTLLKELDAYHSAWFELNRHHYRLALLGKLDDDAVLSMIKLHRLFSQQARLSRSNAKTGERDSGVFRIERRGEGPDFHHVLTINQIVINQDPDQLRQWLLHRQSELFFRHLALGRGLDRVLLHPQDHKTARSRMEALGILGKSLGQLVPDEGRMLSEALLRTWSERSADFHVEYAEPPEDAAVEWLRSEYLETIADLSILAQSWEPPARRKDLLDDVINLVRACVPFLERSTLKHKLKEAEGAERSALGLLAATIDQATGNEFEERALECAERKRIADWLISDLLINMSFTVFDDNREGRDSADRAMAFVDQARDLDLKIPRVEYIAARYLLIGEYLDESKQALSRFYKLEGSADSKLRTSAAELLQLLNERRKKKTAGKRRSVSEVEEDLPERPAGSEEQQLLQDIQDYPSSIDNYERLVHLLFAKGAGEEAVGWSERAQLKCLGRQTLLRARTLNLESLGLQSLAAVDAAAVTLYLRGAYLPCLEAISSMEDAAKDYPVRYLEGKCLLAQRRKAEALAAFEQALENCPRAVHRSVLKRLATSIDQLALESVRQFVSECVAEENFTDALQALGECLADLQEPSLGLLDLAQIYLRRAVVQLNHPMESDSTLTLKLAVPWNSRLQTALQGTSDDFDRTENLANLSTELQPLTAKDAAAILDRIQVYRQQSKVVGVLAKSAELLQHGAGQEALNVLEELGPAGRLPQVLQQRAFILLHLERFADADAAAEQLAGVDSAVARQFAQKFPVLRLRQRLRSAGALLRQGHADAGLALIEGLSATNPADAAELAYVYAFGLSLQGYQAKREGNLDRARAALRQAMRRIEAVLPQNPTAEHQRFQQLYEKIDRDLELMQD